MGFSKHKTTYALIGGSFLIGFIFIVITQLTSGVLSSANHTNQMLQKSHYTAAADYIPLAPIPNFTDQGSSPKGVSSTLSFLFRAGLIIAVLLSIIMTIVGGVEYMTMDALHNKADGRKKIYSAVIGLILALSAWTILNTVNPRILMNPESNLFGDKK